MHLVRTRPFSLGREFDTFFQAAQRGFDAPARTWAPRVDVYETDNTLNLRFELAGFDPENLEVTLEDGLLKVTGTRSFELPENAQALRTELTRGSFARSMRVGDAYDADSVSAAFSNGLLEVTLEKRPEVLPRSIDIEVR